MAMFMLQDQQSYIKIEVRQNMSATEIFGALQKACLSSALLYSQVARWGK